MPEPLRSTSSPRLWLAAVFLLSAGACLDTSAEETALRRGDVAFAADSLEEALAEYRLAVRQTDGDPEALVRAAHAYVALGRVDEAAELYTDALERAPEMRDQAVADLIHMARRAAGSGERFQMASAVEEALRLQPSIGLDDMALPLARHYFQNGEYGRALPLYQRALSGGGDTLAAVVFEVGQAYEEIGDCLSGLVFFERFRDMVGRRQRGEVDWYIGSCSFRLARELRDLDDRTEGQSDEALRFLDRVLEVGEPRSILGEAWFERGELLAALGDCDAALESFAQVRIVEGDVNSALVQRAQERYDQIRFGEGIRHLRPDRPCG